MYKKLVLVSVMTGILCGSWAVAQPMVGDSQKGAELYKPHCLRCHGEALDGNGPDGQYLIIAPADLRSRTVRMKTDWELMISISNGVLFTPMHGWRGRLTDPP